MDPLAHDSRKAVLPPIGLKGSRGAVLLELKRHQPLTAKALADRLGMSLNAVRHHFKELEAAGLIRYERASGGGGVGAPAFLYQLTEAGEAHFPRRYQETLEYLLTRLIQREGRESAVALLEVRYRESADRLRGQLAGASAEERLAVVGRFLAEEGYMPEWSESGADARALVEHNCPIRALAEQYPEVCAAEVRFLEEVLNAKVERTAHMVEGCGACSYQVSPPDLVRPLPLERRGDGSPQELS